jgi:hypothetical protein
MFNSKLYKAHFFEVLKLVLSSNPHLNDISVAWNMFARQIRNTKISSFLNSFVILHNNAETGSIIMSLDDYRICTYNNVFVSNNGTWVFRASFIDPNLDSVFINVPVISSVIMDKNSDVTWMSTAPVASLRSMANGGEFTGIVGSTGFEYSGYSGHTGYTGYVGSNANTYIELTNAEVIALRNPPQQKCKKQEEKDCPKNSKIIWLKKQQEKSDLS